jgi:hypothetical protein
VIPMVVFIALLWWLMAVDTLSGADLLSVCPLWCDVCDCVLLTFLLRGFFFCCGVWGVGVSWVPRSVMGRAVNTHNLTELTNGLGGGWRKCTGEQNDGLGSKRTCDMKSYSRC